MTTFYLLMALIGGFGLSVQAGVNAQLRLWVGDPIRAALVSFLIGTVALLIGAFAVRAPWPPLRTLGAAPWWVWIGGLLGAFYVIVTVVAGPRLGAAVLIALVVAGQMLAALLIDQLGALGFPQHTITPGRIAGAFLVLAGVFLIRRF